MPRPRANAATATCRSSAPRRTACVSIAIRKWAWTCAQHTGFHGRLKPQPCRACHTDHRGREAKIAPLDERAFDHTQTDFALRGAHAAPELECRSCHATGKKLREAPGRCIDCHAKTRRAQGAPGQGVRRLPRRGELEGDSLRPRQDALSLARRARAAQVRELPPGRALQGRRRAPAPPATARTTRTKARWARRAATVTPSVIGSRRASIMARRASRFAARTCRSSARAATRTTVFARPPAPASPATARTTRTRARWARPAATATPSATGSRRASTTARRASRCAARTRRSSARAATRATALKETPSTCVACHRKDDRHKGALGESCGNCHTERNWKESKFDHAKTAFPLLRQPRPREVRSLPPRPRVQAHAQGLLRLPQEGRHAPGPAGHEVRELPRRRHLEEGALRPRARRASRCSAGTSWSRAARAMRPRATRTRRAIASPVTTRDDVHKRRLGPRCETCHNARSWKSWDFNHDRQTRVRAGRGAPQGRAAMPATASRCRTVRRCQPVASAAMRPTTCTTAAFGKQCERCHVTSTFKQIKQRLGMNGWLQ